MILDIAFVAVFAGILIALWANYRLERQIVRLRTELDHAAARALEWELTR